MAAKPNTKAIAEKRRRAPREEFVDYVGEIDGWDWGYSLLLNTERDPSIPTHELRHLQITEKLLRPAGLKKTDRFEVLLLPTCDMNEKREQYEPSRRLNKI